MGVTLQSEWVCSPLMSDCRATCSSSVSNSSRSLFYFIAPLCYAHSLHGFNHSNEPRRSTISFIAASQMNSHHLWAALCQKGNHSVSVPSDFTWLQLNQKEKESYVLCAAVSLTRGAGVFSTHQFILYSPETAVKIQLHERRLEKRRKRTPPHGILESVHFLSGDHLHNLCVRPRCTSHSELWTFQNVCSHAQSLQPSWSVVACLAMQLA